MNMRFQKTVIITGATGFIGCHLAARFLQEGYRVIAFSRNRDGLSARQRLLSAIARVDSSIEMTDKNLIDISTSMNDYEHNWLRQIREKVDAGIDEIWHLAAIFKINKQSRYEVEDINVQGVKRLLNLLTNVNGSKFPRYFHVSTAYSQGKYTKVVEEEIYQSKHEFRSIYEWSKNCGEHIVAEYQKKYLLDATILRPSIVVGAFGSKVVNNAAYYAVLETLYSVTKKAEASLGANFNGNIGVRLWCDPKSVLNIVPVDFVVEGMYRIAQHERLINTELKVFNIVNENPPTLKFLFDVGCQSLGITGVDLVEKKAFEDEPMTPLERFFERRIIFQAPYMRENILFSMAKFRNYVPCSVLSAPVVDRSFLKDINKNFIEVHESKLYQKSLSALSNVMENECVG